MRIFCRFRLIIIAVCAVFCGAANAIEITSDKYGAIWNIDQNISVLRGVTRDVKDIFISRSVFIENHGDIYGTVHVCAGCELFIRNAGTINGVFDVDGGAVVNQIIESVDELSHLDVNGMLNVSVGDIGVVDFKDILNAAANADKITLRGTSIVIDANVARDAMPVIELVGLVSIHVNNARDLGGQPILSNLVGDGMAVVTAESDNPLFVATGVFQDGNIYLDFVREMDYLKILGPGRGDFLNFIRSVNPDDAFLGAMDAAKTMDELHRIMRRSGRMRPINLMRSISIFNEMTDGDRNNLCHADGMSFALSPEYVASDDFTVYAAQASVTLNMHGFNIGVNGYAGRVESLDGFDKYTADFYGGGMTLGYNGRRLYLSGRAGMASADFETPPLYDAGDILVNPRGKMRYAAADTGVHLYPLDVLRLTPFVGMRMAHSELGTGTRDDVVGRAGLDVNFTYDMDDVEYTYGVRVVPNFDGAINADVHADFWSMYDGFGGGVKIGLYHDNTITAYRVSVNMRYAF